MTSPLFRLPQKNLLPTTTWDSHLLSMAHQIALLNPGMARALFREKSIAKYFDILCDTH